MTDYLKPAPRNIFEPVNFSLNALAKQRRRVLALGAATVGVATLAAAVLMHKSHDYMRGAEEGIKNVLFSMQHNGKVVPGRFFARPSYEFTNLESGERGKIIPYSLSPVQCDLPRPDTAACKKLTDPANNIACFTVQVAGGSHDGLFSGSSSIRTYCFAPPKFQM